MKQSNRLIGVTGNIGSGKSTVCKIISSFGYPVISADDITGYAYNIAKDQLKTSFGEEIFLPNGDISKFALGEIVFKDKSKLAQLNTILHPLILDAMFTRALEISGTVFLEIPLLFECGLVDRFKEIWFVSADTDIKIQRVMSRNNLSYDDAIARLNSQNQNEELKRNQSHIIFLNNGSLDELKSAVAKEIYRL